MALVLELTVESVELSELVRFVMDVELELISVSVWDTRL